MTGKIREGAKGMVTSGHLLFPRTRALFPSLVILLAHMTVITRALLGVSISGGGQPLTVMTRALRTAFGTLVRRASFRYVSPDEGPPVEDTAWNDELRSILQLHPAGALALGLHPAGALAHGLRMSSLEPEPEEQALAALDPDFLEEESADCVCTLCFGVMVDGHSFCRACYLHTLHERKPCPTCRHPVAAERIGDSLADGRSYLPAGANSTFKLVRPLEGIIESPSDASSSSLTSNL